MSVETCSNEECKKTFKVSHMGPRGIAGGEELEPIVCPYCGQTLRSERTSGWFVTEKIEETK